eukprot:GFKZ01001293.1.p1 GENE.GFKZ01001293.1~~GFKZ01001293.1.p1  ORF type:complete len:632 (-),score=116.36 GFKZ01001293.1:841-2736(-)
MNFHTSPLTDYTESQLLALPANSRLLFAEDLSSGLLTYDTPPPDAPQHHYLRRRILTPPDPARLPDALSRIRALRCMQHGMSAFSLYPTTDHQHAVNKFLWNAANAHSFRLSDAANLFHRNVFIISMPAPLFDCLTRLTWNQLEDALLFVLLSLAHDPNGWQLLRDELAAPLAARLANFPLPITDIADRCDPHAFHLLLDLVMDRISWTGPWIMPTTLCFLSASDMTELLEGRYDRPIFSTPEKFEPVHSMMWSIYSDWQIYRQVYVRWGGKTRMDALELMARTISRGAQNHVERAISSMLALTERAEELAAANQRPRSYLEGLPVDVLLGKILPKLCEAYASDDRFGKRRSRPASHVVEGGGGLQPVRFSLKSWVLEDNMLHQFYHSVDEEMMEEDVLEEDSSEVGDTNQADHLQAGWEGNTVEGTNESDEMQAGWEGNTVEGTNQDGHLQAGWEGNTVEGTNQDGHLQIGLEGNTAEGTNQGGHLQAGWEGNSDEGTNHGGDLQAGSEGDSDAETEEAEVVEVVLEIEADEIGMEEEVEVVAVVDVEGMEEINEEMVVEAVITVEEVDTDTVVSVDSFDGATVPTMETAAASMVDDSEDEGICGNTTRSQRRRLDEQGSFEVVHGQASM